MDQTNQAHIPQNVGSLVDAINMSSGGLLARGVQGAAKDPDVSEATKGAPPQPAALSPIAQAFMDALVSAIGGGAQQPQAPQR